VRIERAALNALLDMLVPVEKYGRCACCLKSMTRVSPPVIMHHAECEAAKRFGEALLIYQNGLQAAKGKAKRKK